MAVEWISASRFAFFCNVLLSLEAEAPPSCSSLTLKNRGVLLHPDILLSAKNDDRSGRGRKIGVFLSFEEG